MEEEDKWKKIIWKRILIRNEMRMEELKWKEGME